MAISRHFIQFQQQVFNLFGMRLVFRFTPGSPNGVTKYQSNTSCFLVVSLMMSVVLTNGFTPISAPLTTSSSRQTSLFSRPWHEGAGGGPSTSSFSNRRAPSRSGYNDWQDTPRRSSYYADNSEKQRFDERRGGSNNWQGQYQQQQPQIGMPPPNGIWQEPYQGPYRSSGNRDHFNNNYNNQWVGHAEGSASTNWKNREFQDMPPGPWRHGQPNGNWQQQQGQRMHPSSSQGNWQDNRQGMPPPQGYWQQQQGQRMPPQGNWQQQQGQRMPPPGNWQQNRPGMPPPQGNWQQNSQEMPPRQGNLQQGQRMPPRGDWQQNNRQGVPQGPFRDGGYGQRQGPWPQQGINWQVQGQPQWGAQYRKRGGVRPDQDSHRNRSDPYSKGRTEQGNWRGPMPGLDQPEWGPPMPPPPGGPSSNWNQNGNRPPVDQATAAEWQWKAEEAVRRQEAMIDGKTMRTPFFDSGPAHGGYPLDGRATANFRPGHHPQPFPGPVGRNSANGVPPMNPGMYMGGKQSVREDWRRNGNNGGGFGNGGNGFGRGEYGSPRGSGGFGGRYGGPQKETITTTATTIDSPAKKQVSSDPTWSALEREILAEHNKVRQNPKSYIPILERYMSQMDSQGNIPDGCGKGCTLLTQEGQAAVQEAIRFLETQQPVPPLQFNEALAESAKSHASDQQDGSVGHVGSDGSQPAQRIKRAVPENLSYGENIAYGHTQNAPDIVRNLLVDDGVRDRGHRKVLFSPNLNMVGVGCGPHDLYEVVSVCNYAKVEKPIAGGDSKLSVRNDSSDEILALFCGDSQVLNGSIYPGQSVTLDLPPHIACRTSLEVHLGGNFEPIFWNDVYVCGSELRLDRSGQLRIQY